MNEKDVVNLYQSLARCRDGFMQTRTRRDERQPVRRRSEREREVMECFRNRCQAAPMGWGRFSGQNPDCQAPPAPSNFYAR